MTPFGMPVNVSLRRSAFLLVTTSARPAAARFEHLRAVGQVSE
jgi:hypothetical protein